MPEPARLSASEVCRLAGYGRVTLRRRVAEGRMPKPVDRGREALFDAAQVRKALGVADESGDNGRAPSWGKV